MGEYSQSLGGFLWDWSIHMALLLSSSLYFALLYSLCSLCYCRKANGTQPMVQWSESYGHPGLIFCITQSTNNPLALYFTPDTITMQVNVVYAYFFTMPES